MPTTADGLPYPAPTDDVDVAGDIQALATAIDGAYYTKAEADAKYRLISNSYTQAQVDAELDARTPSQQFSGASRVHFGTTTGTPTGGGLLTITHGAGFTPNHVIAVAADSDSQVQGRKGIVCNVLTDTITGSTFQVRTYRNDDATAHDLAVRINYICVAN